MRLFPTKFIKYDNDEDEEEDQDKNVEDEGDEILHHSDTMQGDASIVATPINANWYYLFPEIITQDEDDEDLDERQILDVINRRRQSKYNTYLHRKCGCFKQIVKRNRYKL